MFVIYNTADGNRIIGWVDAPEGGGAPPQAPGSLVFGEVTDAEFANITDLTEQGFAFNEPLRPFQGFFEAYYFPGNSVGSRVGIISFGGGIPPVPTQQAADIRADRNRRLLDVDFTQLPDVPISPALRAEFATYRQALRDVPQQSGFPSAVTWPAAPVYVKT